MELQHDRDDCSKEATKSTSEKSNLAGQKRASRRNLGFRRRSYGSKRPAYSEKPSLADFAPHLMNQLETSSDAPGSEDADKDWHSGRSRTDSSGSDDSWSLRSPLHKNRRGQEPSVRRGSYVGRPRHSIHQRQTGTRYASGRASSVQVSPSPRGSSGVAPHTRPRNRQVRKCLWADDEDEAFIEGDVCDKAEVVRTSTEQKTPTKNQLARRQKDIDYGKATVGYRNYLMRIPREQRGNFCPETPDKFSKIARRNWDAKVRQWRRLLHQWDIAPQESLLDEDMVTPTKIQPRRVCKDSPSPLRRGKRQSLPSTPSDQGYATTPESSKTDWSFHEQHDDDADFFLAGDQFPPLPSSENKLWWQVTVTPEDSSAEEMDEEELDESVQKMKI